MLIYFQIQTIMDLVPIHALESADKEEAITQTVKILNYEWPRSDTIRRRGLESSSESLPCNLVMHQRSGPGGSIRVIGHSRISKIPADSSKVFIESVVIHPQLR